MKTLETLEQEAKQAREVAQDEFIETFVFSEESSRKLVDKLIEASVAMVTYQLALGMEDADQIWNESGAMVISEKLPEVLQGQEERDSDGWIEWNGGMQPIDDETMVKVKFRGGMIDKDIARKYYWKHDMCNADIIAYRIVKGE